MWRRRLLSLPVLACAAVLAVVAGPVLFLISLPLTAFRALRSLPRAVLFALGYVAYECAGVARLAWVWARHRGRSDWLRANRDVQFWWAGALLNLGLRIYRLRIEVTGAGAVPGPSAILIARHTSIADTVLPIVYFAAARHESLRYILKRELTVMPCLDIAGHRLPNLFIDRSGTDTPAELAAVRQLIESAGPDESLLVYPEGTRFTRARHARLASRTALREQLERWPDLLPPRLGGITTLLQSNPGKDVVMLCHTDFEGSANPRDLINGSWVRQRVHLHFWRVPYANVPADLQAFTFAQWDRMQQCVSTHTG